MVYCGKPSQACAECRQKKTRCDKALPSCTQCIRANRTCPGYRNQLDLMFRSENDAVRGKSRARQSLESVSRFPSLRPSTSSTSTTSSATPEAAISSTSGWKKDLYRNAFGLESSKDSQYYFDEVEDFARPLAIMPAISPTLEERARGYFSSNSSMWLRNYDLVAELCRGCGDNEPLVASISPVGMASFANTIQGPELLNRARKSYIKALQLTNAALRSPTEVQKDTTLFSILILSLFEMVAGRNEHSLEAWNEHINGASTLINLRGADQFKTRAGQRLFLQVASKIMISCTQRAIPIPEHIVELRQIAEQIMGPLTWPAWKASAVVFDFANLRSAIREAQIVGPRAVIEAALAVDRKFLEAFEDVPEGWKYRTIYLDHDDESVWNRRYDIYNDYSYWAAQIWNGMRTCRILLHEMIHDQLLAASSAMTHIFTEEEAEEQNKQSNIVMLSMQADILASVPLRQSPSLEDKATALLEGSRGYFILWPLYLAGAMDLATPQTRTWVIGQLRAIATQVGISQATVLADILEKHGHITAWHTKPAPRSRKDQAASSELTAANDPEEWWDLHNA